MTRIDRFTTRAEAQLACGLLTAHGFQAVVITDDVGGMRPDVGFGIGGTVVLVPDEDYVDAVALLDAVLAEQDRFSDP